VLIALVWPIAVIVAVAVPFLALLGRNQAGQNALVIGAWLTDFDVLILLLARRRRWKSTIRRAHS
jgi:hypothetical protein